MNKENINTNKETINIDETIKKAVKIAIREYKREEREDDKGRVFHNTKLLMKHYNSLKCHADHAVYKFKDIKEIDEYANEDRVYIASIMRSRLRTMVMVSHIEMALYELEEKKRKEERYEQYKALKLYYIDKYSYEEIQAELTCGKNTPPRWIEVALKDLSILLFGIDGLKLDDMV